MLATPVFLTRSVVLLFSLIGFQETACHACTLSMRRKFADSTPLQRQTAQLAENIYIQRLGGQMYFKVIQL